jgi:hypothetical protein
MVVLGAVIARVRGWRPAGKFTLGRWGWLVNVVALVYGVGATTNMFWPRAPQDPWYLNYGMLLTTAIVVVTGGLYMLARRPHLREPAEKE